MRNVFIAATALSGLAAALPQNINISAAKAVAVPDTLGPAPQEAPESSNYDQTAAQTEVTETVSNQGAITKTRKRSDTCSAVEAGGAGPVPGDGSVAAYTASDSILSTNAQSASTPSGYTQSFSDLSASTQQIGYLTYKNIDSGSYDVDACATFCDSETFCLGFNIYYERDPKYTPDSSCTNPAPQTNVKCALYGYPVSAATATNQGQYREQFQVVIAGSNGYSKAAVGTCKGAPSVADFNAPTNLPGAIQAPLITKDGQSYDTYNGMRLFNDNPYDPSLCAAACEAQTAFDKEHLVDSNGEYKPCNFFTSYILTDNDVPLGTYCALYTQSWDSSYATNTGYTSGSDNVKVICPASYAITTQDPGHI